MSDNKEAMSRLLALFNENRNQENTSKSEPSTGEDLIKQLIMRRLSASENLSKEDKADILKKRYKTFNEEYTFQKGMLVSWKQGLKNKGVVAYGEPAIVIEHLSKPIFDTEKGAGSPYFMEPLDLVLAFLDEDNDFMIFYSDSRRFMPYQP